MQNGRLLLILLFVIVSIILGTPCGMGAEDDDKSPCPTAGDEDLAALLLDIRKKHRIPAIAGAIVTGEGISAMAAVGVRKRRTDIPVTLEDKWHLGSETKAMTATLIGKLIEQGMLKWETTVAEVFPELSAGFHADLREVTILHLLSHRSGLPPNPDMLQYLGESGPEERLRVVEEELAKAPQRPPGTKYVYSNLGYFVAGAMVEKLTGESWRKNMIDHVFTSLKMEHYGFGGVGTPGEIDQPWGHNAVGMPVGRNGPAVDNPPVLGPAGRIHCTMQDWAAYIADLIRGARGEPAILEKSTYETLLTPPFGGDYALGWLVAERESDGERILKHSGSNTMNYANAWVLPERGFAVLVCINQGGNTAFKATEEAAKALVEYHGKTAATGEATGTDLPAATGEQAEAFQAARRSATIAGYTLSKVQRWLHEVALKKIEPDTGLYHPDGAFNYRDAWADCYPFLVWAAWAVDRQAFDGPVRGALHAEIAHCEPGFFTDPKNTFGGSEYVKDGLIAIVEITGRDEWLDRMKAIQDEIWSNPTIETEYGRIPSKNIEVNGEQIQALARMFTMTGERKYLEYAERLADHYLLPGGFVPQRLRDHGCEIIGGLGLLLGVESVHNPAKAEVYLPFMKEMLDTILKDGANEDGIMFNTLGREGRLSDGWGYNYVAYLCYDMVAGEPVYRPHIERTLQNLSKPLYAGYPWEGNSIDGYADSIEGGLYLLNRLPVPEGLTWADRETAAHVARSKEPLETAKLWGTMKLESNGVRTAIMHALMHTRGLLAHPWRRDLTMGASETEAGGLAIVAKAGAAGKDWSGKLVFDIPRHRIYMGFKHDWPRMNTLPEWFTVEPGRVYAVENLDAGTVTAYAGRQLHEGLAVDLQAGEELRLLVNPMLKTADIRIRDPFILVDRETETYYMYAQSANRDGSGFTGVEAYTSKDLKNWSPPRPVLTLPDDAGTEALPKNAGIRSVWAPEVHVHNGRFYLFVTLTYHETLPIDKPVDDERWPGMHIRGTHVFHADGPLGPFRPFKATSHTPEDWMALDGTLFVEEGTPYMVFCHEWVETIDGTMDYVRLKDDLSDTAGVPKLMFRASDAPGAYTSPTHGKITDGCFLYRSPKSGRLFMIWSTFIPGKDYCVLLTHSETGKIGGPWTGQKIIYSKNGGHGMIFESFDGRLLMALHQPNTGPLERLHLFEIEDTGETLEIVNELDLN